MQRPPPTHPLTPGLYHPSTWKPYEPPAPPPSRPLVALFRPVLDIFGSRSRARSQNPAPPTANATVVDLSTVLPGSEDCFALIIDDFLSAEECANLVAHAEQEENAWQPARTHVVNHYGRLVERILSKPTDAARVVTEDPKLAEWLYERVRPFLLKEVRRIKHGGGRWRGMFYEPGEGTRWRVKGVNQRMRFLRYLPGQFFAAHQDGTYFAPSSTERSFLTLQIYLSDGDGVLKGGATRFFSAGKDEKEGRGWEVEPKVGRALVFQHNGLWHEGAVVKEGMKIALRTELMYELEG